MMGRVMSVAAADGYPAAINVCAQEARGMAADVSSRLNVNIGRTSLRLRNTANSAPAWALPHIQANADSAGSEATSYLATGPGGELGVLSPIMVGAACMNCHGSAEQLAPGVADALAQLYPADAATGFAEGDLRGWFWVEVEGTLLRRRTTLATALSVPGPARSARPALSERDQFPETTAGSVDRQTIR